MVAWRLFGPRRRETRDALWVLSLVRSVAGIGLGGLIADHYGLGDATSDDAVYASLISLGVTVVLSGIAITVAAVRESDYSTRTWRPVLRAVAAVAAMLLCAGLDYERNQSGAIALLIGLFFAVWYAWFFITSALCWLLFPLVSSEKYPIVAPVVTIIAVVTVTAFSLSRGSGGLPTLVWLGMSAAGALTTAGLAGAEIYRVRRRAAA